MLLEEKKKWIRGKGIEKGKKKAISVERDTEREVTKKKVLKKTQESNSAWFP